MSELNLDSFNDILFSGLKNSSTFGKVELLEMELSVSFDIFTELIHKLLDELEDYGYESKTFNETKNVIANGEHLIKQIEELKKQGAAGT